MKCLKHLYIAFVVATSAHASESKMFQLELHKFAEQVFVSLSSSESEKLNGLMEPSFFRERLVEVISDTESKQFAKFWVDELYQERNPNESILEALAFCEKHKGELFSVENSQIEARHATWEESAPWEWSDFKVPPKIHYVESIVVSWDPERSTNSIHGIFELHLREGFRLPTGVWSFGRLYFHNTFDE